MLHKVCQNCHRRLAKVQKLWFRAQNKSYSTHAENKWNSKEVRSTFLDFYCSKKDHTFVKSSSVLPGKGQGTYFTNAGMNQFKPIFLGTAASGSDLVTYRRVANSQKCVRVGGKHNDLEDVGADLTHHTFFEMLGSWSFGDYFKREACTMALELLKDVYKLPVERLYFTYFGGDETLQLLPDLETREIWRQLGIPEGHILPFGMTDNFWDMGDTGPCGPCTEIHYDHVGHRDATHLVNIGSPDVVEIWNLVFMQYNRETAGLLQPLPQTHVDTGMGLERICAVLQGQRSNYNTDLFLPLFHHIHKTSGVRCYGDQVGLADPDKVDTAYRIIADHTRMATICIADGLLPGIFDLEHKLRSVIYRALYQSHEVLNAPPGMLGQLVCPVVESLGDAFPEVSQNEKKIQEVLDNTEQRYLQTIEDSKKKFNKLLKKYPAARELLTEKHILLLNDNISLDIIELIAHGQGISMDHDALVRITDKQKMSSKSINDIEYPCLTPYIVKYLRDQSISTTDDELKYLYTKRHDNVYAFQPCNSTISCLLNDENVMVTEISSGEKIGIVTMETGFYAEKGGQKADVGTIKSQTGKAVITDTQCHHGYLIHIGTVTDGYLATSQPVVMEIDGDHRTGCMRNHTATHLVNAALRQVKGSEVKQQGSSVVHNKLTFDFSCFGAVSASELSTIETLVKSSILHSLPIHRETKVLQDALNTEGIISLNNVDYPSNVTVISVDCGDTSDNVCRSAELCGGTHVLNTGDIGDFCITSLTGVSSGTKSIVCLTGQDAKQAITNGELLQQLHTDLQEALKTGTDIDHCTQLQTHIYQILGSEQVPKVISDEMKSNMETVDSLVYAAANKQALKQLEQNMKTAMLDEKDFVILYIKMKTLPKINKLLKSIPVAKPMILVVLSSNNTDAFIALPKDMKANRLELTERFKDGVNGRLSQSTDHYSVVSLRGVHVDRFMDLARTLMTEYCQQENVSQS